MRALGVAVVLAVFLMPGIPAPIVAAGEVSVGINAPASIAPNNNFTVTVDVSELVDLNAVQYDISFDPSLLRLDDITAGQIDSTVIAAQFNEISSGTYRVIQFMGLGKVSGSGHLAELHFHTLLAGQGDINLSNGVLSGMEGEISATWSGGSVSIISAEAGGGQASSSTPSTTTETETTETPTPPSTAAEPQPETTKPEAEADKGELPATTPPPSEPGISAVPGPTSNDSKAVSKDSPTGLPEGNETPALSPPAKTVNWPVLWGVIGGIIIAGLLVFFQVRRRSY